MIRQSHCESMLRNRLASTIVAALAATLLAGPAAANGPSPCEDGVYFSGHAFLCAVDPGTETPPPEKGAQFTLTEDLEETWRLESDYACITGIEIITWDMRLNKVGRGERWGEIVMRPDTYSGTLEESIYLKGGQANMLDSGTYIGTGDLDGYMIDYQITPSMYQPSQSPCGEDPPLYIMDYTGYVYISE